MYPVGAQTLTSLEYLFSDKCVDSSVAQRDAVTGS